VLYTEYGLRECNVIRTRILDRGKHAKSTVLFLLPIPGLHLSLAIRRARSRIRLCSLRPSPSLPRGTKQVMLGNEDFTYAPGYCLVVSSIYPSLEAESRRPRKQKPFLGMYMDLDVKTNSVGFGPPERSNGRRSLIAVFSSAE